jgi:zinc protease
VIGDLADMQTIQRDELFNHYRTYYRPNNAVLAAAGDFQTGEMLGRIRELFESIPAGGPPPRNVRVEPPQRGERRVTVEGPGETTYIQAAYHAPPATHPDFFPYLVMDSLLTGPSSLNMFGSGISNKTSRLYLALVETELAVSVGGGLSATIDPFLHNIIVTVHPGRSSEEVAGALDEEIRRFQESPPQAEEVARALKQARALFAYGSESITNQGFWMGYSEMIDHYEWFLTFLDQLAEVTPQDVQRIAQTYLRPGNRVLGVYIPLEASTLLERGENRVEY